MASPRDEPVSPFASSRVWARAAARGAFATAAVSPLGVFEPRLLLLAVLLASVVAPASVLEALFGTWPRTRLRFALATALTWALLIGWGWLAVLEVAYAQAMLGGSSLGAGIGAVGASAPELLRTSAWAAPLLLPLGHSLVGLTVANLGLGDFQGGALEGPSLFEVVQAAYDLSLLELGAAVLLLLGGAALGDDLLVRGLVVVATVWLLGVFATVPVLMTLVGGAWLADEGAAAFAARWEGFTQRADRADGQDGLDGAASCARTGGA